MAGNAKGDCIAQRGCYTFPAGSAERASCLSTCQRVYHDADSECNRVCQACMSASSGASGTSAVDQSL
jgi:hypothetical protein